MQLLQTYHNAKKIRDFTDQVGAVGRETSERRRVCDAGGDRPRRKGVVVDAYGLQGRQAGEEIGGEGREAVVVGYDCLNRAVPGEARERAGELVILDLKVGQFREVT